MNAEEHSSPSERSPGGFPPAELCYAPSLDVDLYCLYCGYNLRGLADDPIRCPECGNDNDRFSLNFPAELIRPVLRRMETAPSTCVGVTLIALMCAVPLVVLGDPVVLLLLAAFGVVWYGAYWWTRTAFEGRSGWKTIVRDFHLATLCWTAALAWLIYVFLVASPQAWASYVLGVMLFPLGLTLYRRGQKTICQLQRQQAVRIARRYVQF